MIKFIITFILCSFSVSNFADNLGEKTYQIACKNCHDPKLSKAIKSPAAFDKKAWDLRFKKAKIEAQKNPAQYKSAIDYLLYSVTIGKGLMYHGGLCAESDMKNKDCSQDALKAAIYYMSQHQEQAQNNLN